MALRLRRLVTWKSRPSRNLPDCIARRRYGNDGHLVASPHFLSWSFWSLLGNAFSKRDPKIGIGYGERGVAYLSGVFMFMRRIRRRCLVKWGGGVRECRCMSAHVEG